MRAVLDVVLLLLDLYRYCLVAVIVLSWLIQFGVVNIRNDVVRGIWNALNALTEPVLRPIRNMLPNMGGLDLSPLIVFIAIYFIENVIGRYIYPNVS